MSMTNPLQMSLPLRTPTWFSTRRLLEQQLQDLHKCTNLNHVKQTHVQILKQNLHLDLYVAPKLISAFSLCHQMTLAINVFNQIEYPNQHLYNTLMKAFVHNSQPSLAFATFFDMQKNGIFADNFTYPFLLKACNHPIWLPMAKMIHTHLEKCGFFGDMFVPNALIDSYCKCGLMGVRDAMKLFVVMGGDKDVVTWNSMIGGLVKAGELIEARKLFDEMPIKDTVSWNTIVDGYVKRGEMDKAFELFKAMPERNVVSWSTMVSGYSKAKDMEMARMLFDKMPVKNMVSWTVIISGYAEKGQTKEAIKLYDRLEASGLKTDNGAVISILAACAESGFLGLGERVHASIEKSRFRCTVNVLNALVDMYAKCGSMNKALTVFNGMSERDLVSWNCMLGGLAMHGHGEKALELFSRMQREGFKPDKVTMIGILCACTHAGLVDEGLRYFNNMRRDYGVVPHIEHYGCVIDLLGRGGRLEEAFRLLQYMPMEPNDVIWGTLLVACRKHNAADLARKVLDRLVKLDPSDPGNYTMLSNIFADVGDWDRVANLRLKMKSTGTQKLSGASAVEVENEVHEFTVFDKLHPKSDKIYGMIGRLSQDMKEAGKCCGDPSVDLDVDELYV